MKLISHRGNINGPSEFENQPQYIDKAIQSGFEVEIDLWVSEAGILYLGHDAPVYKIPISFIVDRRNHLWIHCKNINALTFLYRLRPRLNYFWHQTDTAVVTSHGYIWAYPSPNPIPFSICILPELYNTSASKCVGICSDFIKNYESYGIDG